MSRTGARRGRAVWAWGCAAVLIIAAAGAAWYLRPGASWTAQVADAAEPVTAAVELATLTSQVRLNGQLTYGDAVPLPAPAGAVTVLPVAGQVVELGQRVYEADGAPIVLLRGERPFWRDLSVDSADGEDIRQLQQNLVDLGFYRGDIDGSFDRLTRQAVRDWQKSLGLEQTGAFTPSSVVVADAASIRISQVTARLGEAGTSPATYTETTLRATAKLTEAQARELTAGTPVAVVLPDGTEIDTEVSSVDPGGRSSGEEDAATAPSAIVEFADQSRVAPAGTASVRIVIRDTEEQPATLVVPVTALVATADGGYAVEVYADGEIARTSVQIGLVADARVQVLASGADIGAGPVLAEGDLVVLAR
ncbi:peptidoglycan-binding domain-containing protein [Microbacterium sp. 18062]|uniref:peptidoglycan-binding domain-containing protein n=1 Tax=Microbacterium sp. 18062 TaxID=2681410 RepID=UPI0013588018|nr:peptidoglycan-binding domain-containing protein [Microbacterium sp. 18062]